MFWLLICAGLVILVYYAFVKPFKYWKKMGVPQDPVWKLWRETFFGIVQRRPVTDSVKLLYDDAYGSRYRGIYQFYKPTLTIRDINLIKQITVKDFDHFVDHSSFFPIQNEPMWEKNLFVLKGDQWREMRTTLSPSFTGTKMKIMFGLINDSGKQFVRYFEEQGDKTVQVEMKDVFTRFCNDVIATTAFGVTCDSMRNPDNEFYLMGKKATDLSVGTLDIFKFVFVMLFPKLAKILKIDVFKKEITNFFLNVISSNIKSREQNGIIRPDMIHLLLEARKGKLKDDDIKPTEKLNLDDEEIAAQAFIFFLAGFDSVATLMCFAAYELALHPDIQQRLQSEVDDISDNLDGDLTYDKLSSMKYMDMVISETLRKWPNALAIDRCCVKPYTIQPERDGESPLILNKGDSVTIPIFGLHRDPEFYPDPDRFDPERFSDENISNINPYAYLPFGTGPRACIGNRFALMETKMVFFHLLSKFDIVVTEKTPIPLVITKRKFQLDADGGFWLGLKLRK